MTVLHSVPAQPRHVAIAFQSWVGSPQSIVTGAMDMLDGTGLFHRTGATILWFDDPTRAGRHLVVGAIETTTSAPISQIQTILHAIELRFNGGQVPRVGGLLVAELLWVEGARVATPTLRLPSPSILGTPWGLQAFVATSEDALATTCGAGPDELAFCRAVDQQFRSSKRPQAYETPPDSWVGGELANGTLRAWGHSFGGDEEVLAVAFDALLAADAAARMLRDEPGSEINPRTLFERASARVRKRIPQEAFPVDAPLDSGGIESRVIAWLRAARRQTLQSSILPRRAVVFEINAHSIRGAILGTHFGDNEVRGLQSVESIELVEADRAPSEPRVRTVKLIVSPSPTSPERE